MASKGLSRRTTPIEPSALKRTTYAPPRSRHLLRGFVAKRLEECRRPPRRHMCLSAGCRAASTPGREGLRELHRGHEVRRSCDAIARSRASRATLSELSGAGPCWTASSSSATLTSGTICELKRGVTR